MNTLVKGMLVAAAVFGSVSLVSPAAHATNQQTCVDGTVRSNLSVSWKTNSSVTVGTVNNKPLCSDVTVYFSSYTMPDTYNGKPFSGNATAWPQSKFDMTSVVLKKDATKSVPMTITLPAACKNTQVDVYYGPEITTVTEKGHGKQYITGKILTKTQKECTPETPVVPTPEAQTPATPAPEVTVAATAPVELPHTGTGVSGTVALGAALSAAAYGVALIAAKRR